MYIASPLLFCSRMNSPKEGANAFRDWPSSPSDESESVVILPFRLYYAANLELAK